jgi:hypothetical protein
VSGLWNRLRGQPHEAARSSSAEPAFEERWLSLIGETAPVTQTRLLAYARSNPQILRAVDEPDGIHFLLLATDGRPPLRFDTEDGAAAAYSVAEGYEGAVLRLAEALGARVRNARFETLVSPDVLCCHLDDAVTLRELHVLAGAGMGRRAARWRWSWLCLGLPLAVLAYLGLEGLALRAAERDISPDWLRPPSFSPAGVADAPSPPTAVSLEVALVVVALDDVDLELAQRLGRRMEAATGQPVRVERSPSRATLRSFDAPQDFMEIPAQIGPGLDLLARHYPRAMFVVLTNADIVDVRTLLRFAYALQYPPPRNFPGQAWTVVSTRRLHGDFWTLQPERLEERMFRLLLRTYAEQKLGFARTTDRTSLMFGPLRTLEEIDRLPPELPAVTVGPAP